MELTARDSEESSQVWWKTATEGRNNWMSACQVWTELGHQCLWRWDGDQGEQWCQEEAFLGGAEVASLCLTCPVPWQLESLQEADLKQVYKKSPAPASGYSLASLQRSGGFTFYSGLVFVVFLSFHPITEASLRVALSGMGSCMKLAAGQAVLGELTLHPLYVMGITIPPPGQRLAFTQWPLSSLCPYVWSSDSPLCVFSWHDNSYNKSPLAYLSISLPWFCFPGEPWLIH